MNKKGAHRFRARTISATFENGVLELRLSKAEESKAEESKAKRIEIKAQLTDGKQEKRIKV